jgi:hypothetical protein
MAKLLGVVSPEFSGNQMSKLLGRGHADLGRCYNIRMALLEI